VRNVPVGLQEIRRIRAFIDGWNGCCHPFVWTKTAEQILIKANGRRLQTRRKSDSAPTRTSPRCGSCSQPVRHLLLGPGMR
jgi:hypothetical protein